MTSHTQLRIITKPKPKVKGKIDRILHCYLPLLLIALWTVTCQAEYFSSTDSIPVLAIAEEDLIQWFRNLLDSQAQDFAVYRDFIERVKEKHAVALEDPEEYLGNPMNAYKLIKRIVVDWTIITENVGYNKGLKALKENLTSLTSETSFPDISELRGAAKGLGRLQIMYNLSTTDLADGVINGVNYGSELSIAECFEIGSNLFEAKEYILAQEWLQLVLKLLKSGEKASSKTTGEDIGGEEYPEDKLMQAENEMNEMFSNLQSNPDDFDDNNENDIDDHLVFFELDEEGNLIDESDNERSNNNEEKPTAFAQDSKANKTLIETLEYLTLANYELGQQDDMQVYLNQILEINPEHVFKDLLAYKHTEVPQNHTDSESFSVLQKQEWFANYSRLCQGKQVEQKELHQLKCTLETRNHPLFILAPLRKEELLADPEIVVYHGLLSDKHLDDILEQSEAHMVRSCVGGASIHLVRDERVSQQTWLSYNSSTTKYIYRMVSAITGFDLTNAERLQVANYGIGGQYDPHRDYFAVGDRSAIGLPWIGNRMATHLFFASDVEQGGYTVFPLLNVYAKPVKGSMIMWHNLHKSLDRDKRMLHAGCPVVKGTKRICNIWVHSGYQEFSHPCGLVNDNYKSAHI
ncbi:prolyl 4-hydroxylase subunit alpha-1 [Bactrocera dorsalis]|uniref:procollagen-proline 4-dioxygenase n=1 Tax=Bactrocera dorsalis TaxID=27457 RepID=A0A6I9W3V1_BACDO|nr:prolyl 4-hydroxylase subunit alpha-1 [Bactrocera dorsalis]